MSSDTEQLLSFGDFPMTHSAGNTAASSSGVAQLNVNSPNHQAKRTADEDFLEIRTESSGNPASSSSGERRSDGDAAPKIHSFLSFEYYQQYFNVDTFMVLDRIASSIIPKRAGPNYLKAHIGDAPDLYGPIWIVITLVFSIAISGNVSRYMQQAGTASAPHWHYNFHLVSLAATVILVYVCGVSAGLWAVFKWSLKAAADPEYETDTSNYTPTLLSLLCVYGYSLAIYIPVSILWMIPFSFLQWLLVITAATLSGMALVMILRPAIRNSRFSPILIVGVVAAHFLLACSFMLYFFHVPGASSAAAVVVEKVVAGSAGSPNETLFAAQPPVVT